MRVLKFTSNKSEILVNADKFLYLRRIGTSINIADTTGKTHTVDTSLTYAEVEKEIIKFFCDPKYADNSILDFTDSE